MNKLYCSNCGSAIENDQINIQSDIARCSACSSIMKVSDLLNNSPKVHKKQTSKKNALEDIPKGSKISIEKGDGKTIIIKTAAQGLKKSQVPLIGFNLFWLAFITFWTGGAAFAGGWFAAFSLPFWAVGFGMLYTNMSKIFSREEIKIGNGKITLTRKLPFFSRKKTFLLGEIDQVKEDTLEINALNSFKNTSFSSGRGSLNDNALSTPHLYVGIKKVPFFENITNIEKRWAVNTVSHLVERFKDKA